MTAATDLPHSEALNGPSNVIALLYGRASVDRKKRGRSVRDQFADGEAECALREWPIAARYEDVDRSASRHAKRPREGWNQLVARVEEGAPPGKRYVIVYAEASRSSRDLAVYVKIRELCERTGTLLCYGGRVYDMRIAADRDATAQDALQSERESNAIQYRNERTARLSAAKGLPHGPRPFGYTRRYDEDRHLVGQYPDPVDAPLVREAFERAARRESLHSIAAWFVERGRGPESVTGVRGMLLNNTYIGVRTHKGRESKGTWEPLVPEGLFWKVRGILGDPARRTQRDTRAAHLLSGIAVCGECGGHLRAVSGPGPSARGIPGKHRYGCKANHCVSVYLDRLDAWVEEHLLVWLASPAAAEAFRPRDDRGEQEQARARIGAMQAQLEEARAAASTIDEATGLPQLSVASLAALERSVLPALEREEAAVRASLASGDPLLEGLRSAADVEAVWEGLDLDQRRHVVRSVCRVRLCRARARGVSAIDAERVPIAFIGEPGFEG